MHYTLFEIQLCLFLSALISIIGSFEYTYTVFFAFAICLLSDNKDTGRNSQQLFTGSLLSNKQGMLVYLEETKNKGYDSLNIDFADQPLFLTEGF